MQTSFLTDNPELAAVAIAVAGFFVAKLLARLADRWTLLLQRTSHRVTLLKNLTPVFSRLQPIFRGAVYYATLIVFLLLAVRVLGVAALEDWLAVILGYFPQLFLAGAIILAGYLTGIVAGGLVAGILGEKPQSLMPRIAQAVVVTVAVLTGLHQLDIDVSFITHVIVIVLAAFIGGISLAFALGSRQLVANLLARRELERYCVGSRIRVDGIEGRMTALLGTAVVLESEAGITTIPASRFCETDVTVLHETSEGEDSGD